MSKLIPIRSVVPMLLLSMLVLSGCGPAEGESSGGNTASEPSTTEGVSKETKVESVVATVAGHDEVMEFVRQNAGKVVVLDLWSTACVPCMHEFPNLVSLSQSHSEQVVCASLNIDYIGLSKKPVESYVARVEEFLTQQAAYDVSNFVSSETDTATRKNFEITAIPAVIVFDRSGKLARRLTDATASGESLSYESDVVPAVEALLK